MNGLLLGLANGTTFLVYSAPVLIPLLLGRGSRVQNNWILLAQFLAGRLVGYLIFAILAWATNQIILVDTAARNTVLGAAYAGLALGKKLTTNPTNLHE